ncbi:TMEM175 family protein [Enterococcus hulanensis]|uniref:TMEM175 family protein n=1 Tax=Enterococcus hulanensis TaxID=2559929 RepID=A0ABU3EW89_9ENTE|nr:TMEM175 family protein [Enterococcus hulanensis]MDT2598926.1 TMEM175 family protein [Enterococcus hulanensis]MDT2610577.1 TMEM175 family protein [Enterococcus hulanensis]MDT2614865.1 TMEM175 family protein [Enterococcus hulanensis]MDT2627165.1 TMEM175 family protein [Enterococcus hulanensis]MDT2653935.1 TMEM175 family protein [Enterococcus hulanensis]
MKERVVVFGDAIIAIILTIIVLELPIQTAANGVVDMYSLFRAVGIYFISFCFVANLWFQTGYAFNKIDQVKNKDLVVYLLLLFFLSLVPSATRLLIEDTTKQTLLIYGVLTLIVTFVMRRLIVALTGQSLKDAEQRKRRVNELNRQDLLSIGFRIVVLIFGLFYVRPALIIYLILPILAFLQNIVDREEDNLIATLDDEQQADYFQDRNQVWGNPMRRYSTLLRDSMKANGDHDPDRWKQIMSDWEGHINNEINERKQQLSSMNEHDKRRAENEIDRLEKQKQKMARQEAMTERRINSAKEMNDQLQNQSKKRH